MKGNEKEANEKIMSNSKILDCNLRVSELKINQFASYELRVW